MPKDFSRLGLGTPSQGITPGGLEYSANEEVIETIEGPAADALGAPARADDSKGREDEVAELLGEMKSATGKDEFNGINVFND